MENNGSEPNISFVGVSCAPIMLKSSGVDKVIIKNSRVTWQLRKGAKRIRMLACDYKSILLDLVGMIPTFPKIHFFFAKLTIFFTNVEGCFKKRISDI